MPNKTQEYLNLAQQTAKELTRYWENWTDYLTTASRLYKSARWLWMATACISTCRNFAAWPIFCKCAVII